MTNPEPAPMRLFEVLIDGDGIANSYQVDAAYYRVADGWITFKDSDNKVVYDFPAGRVRMIHRIDPPADKPGPHDAGPVRPFVASLGRGLAGQNLTEVESAYLVRVVKTRTRPE